MPKWSDLGNFWSTLREVDINALRDEAEQPVAIACVGHETALAAVEELLQRGPNRYPPVGHSPVTLVPLTTAVGQADILRGASLLILAVDARQTLSEADAAALARADQLALAALVVILFGARLPASSAPLPVGIAARALIIPDPQALESPDRLATELLRRTPDNLQLAVARRLPGVRAIYARELIGGVAATNGTYSLASSLPEQIPLLNIPFAAADILVLTKNQALLVYRLALAYGAPAEFQKRIVEVAPVVGGGFVWRELARTLVSLVPIWGVVPKVAVAYAGTYATGIAAWRWYERGELVSRDQLQRIMREALTMGRRFAEGAVARARGASGSVAKGARVLGDGARAGGGGLLARIRALLPRRR